VCTTVCTARSRKIYRRKIWVVGPSDDADVGLDAIELTRAGQPPAAEKLIPVFARTGRTKFHDIGVNVSLGRCSRADIVRIVEGNFSDEMTVLANEISSIFRHVDPFSSWSYAKRASRCPQPLCAATIGCFCRDCEASDLSASVDCVERQRDRCGRKATPAVALQRGP